MKHLAGRLRLPDVGNSIGWSCLVRRGSQPYPPGPLQGNRVPFPCNLCSHKTILWLPSIAETAFRRATGENVWRFLLQKYPKERDVHETCMNLEQGLYHASLLQLQQVNSASPAPLFSRHKEEETGPFHTFELMAKGKGAASWSSSACLPSRAEAAAQHSRGDGNVCARTRTCSCRDPASRGYACATQSSMTAPRRKKDTEREGPLTAVIGSCPPAWNATLPIGLAFPS